MQVLGGCDEFYDAFFTDRTDYTDTRVYFEYNPDGSLSAVPERYQGEEPIIAFQFEYENGLRVKMTSSAIELLGEGTVSYDWDENGRVQTATVLDGRNSEPVAYRVTYHLGGTTTAEWAID